jgi:hypothetical protein
MRSQLPDAAAIAHSRGCWARELKGSLRREPGIRAADETELPGRDGLESDHQGSTRTQRPQELRDGDSCEDRGGIELLTSKLERVFQKDDTGEYRLTREMARECRMIRLDDEPDHRTERSAANRPSPSFAHPLGV